MTAHVLAVFLLGALALEAGVFWALVRRFWPELQAFYSKLDRFQKMALAVSAYGLATAFLFAFTSGASFGAGHLAPARCLTVVAFGHDREVGSTVQCLDEHNDGLTLPLPAGVARIVILDSQGAKRLSAESSAWLATPSCPTQAAPAGTSSPSQ